VLAAAVGAALGIAVSYVMVRVVGRAFADDGVDLAYSMSWRSLVIAYALGVLLTLAVVTAAAWRVSRLNIVSAIRDVAEPEVPVRRRGRWLLVGAGLVAGVLLAVSGATGQVYLPWMLGLSLVIVSVVPLARLLGGSERLAYTAASVLLLVLWMLPFDAFESVFGEMSMDFTVWVVGGLVVVVAATWLVTYNADVLLGAVAWLASPFASLRPIVKLAVAYPLRSRFRTGVTLAMFMLVVFTLVAGSTIPTAFSRAFDDVERFGGGFDVRASTAPVAAVADLRAELPPALRAEVVATGAQSYLPVEAAQDGTGRAFEPYPLRGLDEGFLATTTTYPLAAMATGYRSDGEVWAAVAASPGLAVVDAFVVPRRNQWGFGPTIPFQLSGFFVEDGAFDPVPVTVRDPLTGTELHVTVIGVLRDTAPFTMSGITVAQEALAPFGDRALPTVHHLALRDGADPDAVAAAVEAALVQRGVEADSYAALLDDAVAENRLVIRLVQGFMALGLVVGVAALGVVSARAVIERRQQLGVLRAIGFQPAMIRRTLLLETAMVALTAMGAGTLLGLVVSYNVIVDSRGQAGYTDLDFAVPWPNLLVILVAVVAAALLTTLASALRASRVYPAEALRYQ